MWYILTSKECNCSVEFMNLCVCVGGHRSPLLRPQSQLAVRRVCRERKAITAAAVVLRRFLRRQLLPQRLQLSLIHHPLLLQSRPFFLQVLLLQHLDDVLHGVCTQARQTQRILPPKHWKFPQQQLHFQANFCSTLLFNKSIYYYHIHTGCWKADCLLNMDCWSDDTSHLKTSIWALGDVIFSLTDWWSTGIESKL